MGTNRAIGATGSGRIDGLDPDARLRHPWISGRSRGSRGSRARGKEGTAWTADDDVRALTRRQAPGFTTLSDPFVTSS